MRKRRISIAQQRILDRIAMSPEGRIVVYPGHDHPWRGAWLGINRMNWHSVHAMVKHGYLREVERDADKVVYVRADQPT